MLNSIAHEDIKAYLFKVAHGLLMTFSNKTAMGENVPNVDKVFIANFYSHAFVGIFFEWLRSGMRQKP